MNAVNEVVVDYAAYQIRLDDLKKLKVFFCCSGDMDKFSER